MLSRSDFREAVAESILSASSETTDPSDVILGSLFSNASKESNCVLWSLFSSLVDGSPTEQPTVDKKALSLKENLTEIMDSEEQDDQKVDQIDDLLEIHIMAMIRQTLRMNSDDPIGPSTVLIDLGVDSLVASNLRSWFASEFNVGISVLTILDGASVTDLVQQVTQELMRATLDPQISTSSSSSNQSVHTDVTSASEPEVLKTDGYCRVEELSYAQSRYLFLHQYLGDRTAFNVTLSFRINGIPRISDLEAAVQIVSQRHESLRTCYLGIEGSEQVKPCQAILFKPTVHLEVSHVQDMTQLQNEYTALHSHQYSLECGQSIRLRLVTLPPGKGSSFLMIGYPHMCMDGASLLNLLGELDVAYRKEKLPPVSRQYPDFASAQRNAYETGQFALESEFWQKELLPLPEPIPLLPMAKSRSRPSLKDYHTEEVQLNVPWDLMELIGTVCRKNRATRFHFFLGVLRVLLARLTDAEDFCIGIADSNRMDTANHNTVGFLLNLLPVRFKTEVSNESIEFQSTLSDTRDRCYQALRHSSMPFDMLLGELAVPRCNTHSPIFQVLMDWQPQLGSELPLGDESIVCEEMGVGRTVYDLTLLITESSRGDATVHFRLQKALYSHEAAELVSRSFLHLLEAFAGDPTLRLQAPRVWHPSDIQRALELGQGPSYDSQWPSTISRRIEEVSRNQPGNSIAVEDTEGNCWTYSRLMDRVQQLAYVLQSIGGVKPGLFVCIFQHPTAEWVCIMLAIWRLGAVYVPLDLRNPPARLANMVSDCQPTVIVCNQETHADIASLECPTAAVINTTSIRPYPQEITDSIPDVSDPEAPSAILYTSGTTGKPKGIMLRHSSLRNQVEGYVRRWQLGAETVLQQGAMTFNHSLDQMLTGLCNGGRLIVASKAVRGDPVSLTKLIVDKGITYTKATPAEYAMWLQYGSSALRGAAHSWRHAFGGGEHLTVSLSRAFRQLGLPYLQLYNSYGPGEITISSHKSPINYQEAEPSISGSIFPIGYSLPNYATYVVDKDMSLLPTGVSGEILIGGAGPCFGYLGRPELTAERFIANPFATPQFIARGWTTAYRTFDQGRLLRDGSLVIEGRLDGDTQVKIRGIRIELEDIENTIIQTSGGLLVGCVVSLQGDTGANDSQLLVARVVFASRIESMAQQEKQLRKLQAALPLPQYMCPSVMIPVDGLPLTIHGKVDRKAIQALPITQLPLIAGDGEKTDDTQIEVLDEMGLALAVLWRRALDPVPINMASLGRDADFFLIGGNSVMLVKLQWLIQQRFRVSVSLVDIFASSSLQAMAHILQAAPPTNVNWAEETALSLSVASSFPEPQQHVLIPPDSGVSILLTGATGFLGHTLLKVLLDNPRVSRVYAVAVRPSGRGIGRPLADCPRLTVFEGDLSQPRFGLQPSVFERLADSSHAIIHCGANRSFWDGYTILQGSNVTPTRTAIALAQHRRVPIHFLSSEAVEQIVELYDGTPSIDGRNGFLVSKWVSERLLAQANSPITIHRLSQSLKPLEPPQSVLEFFIRIACDLKCLPVMQGCDRVISLAPLTELAAGIAAQVIETILHPQAIDVAVRRHEIPLSMRLSCVVDAIHQRILTETDTAGWDTLDILYWLGKAKRATHFPWFIAAEDVISNETDGVKGAI
jgi:hybrid polyketide synthase/nonribosomal peptide synthetase ACE1